jgi:uncharacterized protein YndB with AHSA1/START domain
MLKAVVIVAALLAVAIAVILALALTKPDSFAVSRSISIKAPPQKIYPLIEDLHAWRGWSPYEKKDPAMQRSFSGAERGQGAVYQWAGNKDVGSGRMEITDVSAPSKIVIKLDFFTPFEGHNIAEFTLAPSGDGTAVTWAMRGPAPLMSKVMQVFLNLDTMIGDDFAAGLASLKSLAEH